MKEIIIRLGNEYYKIPLTKAIESNWLPEYLIFQGILWKMCFPCVQHKNNFQYSQYNQVVESCYLDFDSAEKTLFFKE